MSDETITDQEEVANPFEQLSALLESIEQHLGTRNYARLRLGIGRKPGVERQIKAYVLSRFTEQETSLFENVLNRAEDQVECWILRGIEKAMTEFNGSVKDSEIKDLE